MILENYLKVRSFNRIKLYSLKKHLFNVSQSLKID
jgi:hypothetical protein